MAFEILVYFFDRLAISSEVSTQQGTSQTVEVYDDIRLTDELKLTALIEADSVVALTDELVIVLIFEDALAVSNTVETEQMAYKQSVIELIDSLDMWSELPVQEGVVALTDELDLELIDVFVEGVVELTDELVFGEAERISLKWKKTSPSTPVWTKVEVT